jgi:predicted PurR-regulated permease PerM
MNSNQSYRLASSTIIIILIIITFLILWYTIDVLLLTFAAILLAIFLRSLNDLIRRVVPLPNILSMSLVIGIIITFLTFMTIHMYPIISEQMQTLSQEIPRAWDKLQKFFVSALNLDSIASLYQMMNIQKFLPEGNSILLQATNIFSTTFGFIGSLLVFIVMGIYLAFDPDTYKEGFIALIPSSKQKNARDIIASTNDTLQWWLIGKIISMIIVGILTTLGLWLLNIPMALTLGLFTALLTFIPNIGPIISAIPAILIAFTQGPIPVLYVIALYTAIQSIESYLITPLIKEKTVAQPPALVIFSQLILGLLTGILGLSLATPLLVVLSTIINKSYIENNEPAKEPPSK